MNFICIFSVCGNQSDRNHGNNLDTEGSNFLSLTELVYIPLTLLVTRFHFRLIWIGMWLLAVTVNKKCGFRFCDCKPLSVSLNGGWAQWIFRISNFDFLCNAKYWRGRLKKLRKDEYLWLHLWTFQYSVTNWLNWVSYNILLLTSIIVSNISSQLCPYNCSWSRNILIWFQWAKH